MWIRNCFEGQGHLKQFDNDWKDMNIDNLFQSKQLIDEEGYIKKEMEIC